MIIDLKTEEIIKLNNNQGQGSELNSNMVYSAFPDKTGNIWLGTLVGMNKLTYSSDSIDLYRSKNNNSQCIASNENHALLLDSKNNIWLGAKGKGLNFIDQTNNTCKLFNKKNINLPNVTFNLIIDIKEDLQGNIWISSFNEGLIKYNPNTKIFSQLSFPDLEKKQIIQHGEILDIVIDKANNLWLGMTNHGLVKYDQKGHTLKLIGEKIANKLQRKNLSVKSIVQIKDTLWLGTTYSGLISYTPSTNQIKSYLSDKESLNIVSTAQDNEQNIWLGTSGLGIIKFTPKTGLHQQYQAKDGLADNDVFNIQVDNNNIPWIKVKDT